MFWFFFYLQASQPVRKRRPRRRQGSLRWMRLYRFTGGTVMRRCTPAATSTQVAESTCSSSTTPIHSGAPRVFTTESTTPDKPEYRHKGSQGVCMFVYINICMYVCVCVFVRGGGWRFVWRQPVFVCMCACVRRRKLQIYSGLNHQRETKRHIWSRSLETRLICIYCMCTRDPRCTHARSRYRALGRGVRIPVVYSPPVLAAFTPSCRTLLSWYISPVSSPGLHLSHQSPAQHCPTRWRCGCLCSKWCYHNHKWKLGGSTSLCFPFFLFFFCLFVCLLLSGKGGCLSHKYTEDNVRNQFIIKDVLHNTMPFTQRSSGLCQVCSHSFKQPGFSNLLILFVVTKPPYLYEDLRGLWSGMSGLFHLLLANVLFLILISRVRLQQQCVSF